MVLLVMHDRGYADLQSLKYRAGDSCTALDCKLYSVNFQLSPQLLTQSTIPANSHKFEFKTG